MDNFHDYMLKDIEEKKALLDVFPSNTTLRKEKLIETLNDLKGKYNKSRADLRKYIIYKYEQILPKKAIYSIDIEQKEIEELQGLLVTCNPKTSFFEQMGFDMLLYKLMHYYEMSIEDINKVLRLFLEKFNKINVKLNENYFKINPFLYTYMSYFFKDNETIDYNNIYERLYWKCPKIFEYLIISLRILTTNYSKKFTKYIINEQNRILSERNFKSFEDIINRIKELRVLIDNVKDEDEYDIVHLCMDEIIDINDFVGSEEMDLGYFTIESVDIEDRPKVEQTVLTVKNLKNNLQEYINYQKYTDAIITDFKKDYMAYTKNTDNKTNVLKAKDKEINTLIKKMFKLTLKKFYSNIDDTNQIHEKKDLDRIYEQDQVLIVAYSKVKEYNELYYKEKCKEIVRPNTSIGELLEIIYFYPFFAVKKFSKMVREVEDDSEINIKLNEIRDLIFSPYRKIIDIIPVFTTQDVLQTLTNGYRFENLNLYEDSFDTSNIELLIEKCDKLIRRVKMDKFDLNIEEIKFLAEVNKLKNSNQI